MYYLESASGQQALASQNDLISLIAAPAVAAPTGPARQPENSDIRPKEVNEYLKWHARMGHAGPDRLLKTIQAVDGISKDIEVDKDKCVTCTLSKMTKVVNRLSPLRATKPLKRVFSDFWGKYRIAGIRSKKHFLFFMNDYSRMSSIYICDRSETRQQLKTYKNSMKRQFEKAFQRIRNNNAKKYLAMKTSLEQQEIHLKTTTTYTPEQNGVAERLNRTLVTAARGMLLWSGLPEAFWDEAILTANYIRNRLPARGLNGKTPYKMWHNKKSSVNHIRIFGCLMYTHIPSEIRSKMNKVSEAGIFVEYQSSHQYRIYNPKKGVVETSTAVEFYETHPGGPLLAQEPEQGELEAPEEDYSDDDPADHHATYINLAWL